LRDSWRRGVTRRSFLLVVILALVRRDLQGCERLQSTRQIVGRHRLRGWRRPRPRRTRRGLSGRRGRDPPTHFVSFGDRGSRRACARVSFLVNTPARRDPTALGGGSKEPHGRKLTVPLDTRLLCPDDSRRSRKERGAYRSHVGLASPERGNQAGRVWTASPAHKHLSPEPIVSCQTTILRRLVLPQPTFTDVTDLGYCFPPTVRPFVLCKGYYSLDTRDNGWREGDESCKTRCMTVANRKTILSDSEFSPAAGDCASSGEI